MSALHRQTYIASQIRRDLIFELQHGTFNSSVVVAKRFILEVERIDQIADRIVNPPLLLKPDWNGYQTWAKHGYGWFGRNNWFGGNNERS